MFELTLDYLELRWNTNMILSNDHMFGFMLRLGLELILSWSNST